MSEKEAWSPPYWARLISYLAGIAIFVIQPTLFGPPHFGLLAIDAIVLIGISESALKQVAYLMTIILGRIISAQVPHQKDHKSEFPPTNVESEES